MLLAIFEDQTFENFYPLSLIRPTYELMCGQTKLYEKIIRTTKPKDVCYFAREYLTDVLKERMAGAKVNDLQALQQDDVLLVNGRYLFLEDASLPLDGDEEVGVWEKDENTVLYVRIKQNTAKELTADTFDEFLSSAVSKLPKKKINAEVISYLWDLIVQNIRCIVDDFKKRGKSGIEGEFHSSSTLVGDKSQVYIAPSAKVRPNVTIDVTEGPVTIDEGTVVDPGSFISGPVYIGTDNLILSAKVREGTALGPVCWVGGEIEESIAQGYLNKMHEGFLGHAYAGEGLNLGALTTNSDIKNDFKEVQVFLKGHLFDTGVLKVGAFIGDYTKTSIGTMLNTGSSIGMLSIIMGGDGVLPKFVPSFSWYINRKVTKGFGFGKLIEAANGQLVRRDRPFSEAELEVLKKAYEIAKPERDLWVKKGRR